MTGAQTHAARNPTAVTAPPPSQVHPPLQRPPISQAPHPQVQPLLSSHDAGFASSIDTASSSAVPPTTLPSLPPHAVQPPWSPLVASLRHRLFEIPAFDSYRLFNVPEPSSWTLTTALPPPPSLASPASDVGVLLAPLCGLTFSGQPGVSPLPQALHPVAAVTY
ncbi:unnamed protein product [Cuscuta europaea]|uniref:Uncharacterized protein n=1 Tax=Cuscuta europaea TaxID=41803 RepID=A0A9P0Z3U6_CUSEU|nr:unnamed protein product [Cuscuta europaea]